MSRSAAERIRHRLKDSVKNRVRLRDKNRCVRCGFPHRLTFHHVIPISDFLSGKARGRVNCDANLVMLCQQCHHRVHRKIDCEIGKFYYYIEAKEAQQAKRLAHEKLMKEQKIKSQEKKSKK